jgi:hypothetical protein
MKLHHRSGFALQPKLDYQRAGDFVLISLALSAAWIGLYAGLTARAVGLL